MIVALPQQPIEDAGKPESLAKKQSEADLGKDSAKHGVPAADSVPDAGRYDGSQPDRARGGNQLGAGVY